MKVQYVGPFDRVEVNACASNDVERWVECKNGEVVEVDDARGTSLLEQPDNWQAVKATKTPKDDA